MTARAVAGPRAVTFLWAVVVVAATTLALVPSPVVLRSLVEFPVLVLVAGRAAARLVLGHREPDQPSANGAGAEAILRCVLPVLLGMLALLAVVLLLAVFGIPIANTGVAVGTGAAALALLLIARWRTPSSADVAATARLVGATARRLLGPVLAAAVLAAAVAGAVALRPVPVDRYTQLALDEPAVLAGRSLSTRVGAPVELSWTLRGYGAALPATGPAVHVTVGGGHATGVSTTTGPVRPGTAPGVVDDRHGTVTFAAPTTVGLYDVRLTVGPDASSTLVVQLEVTR